MTISIGAFPRRRSGERNDAVAGEVVRAAGRREQNPVKWDRRRRTRDRLLALAAPVVIIAAWQVCASTGIVDRRFYGAPSTVFSRAADLISSGSLLTDIRVSVVRMLIGYLLGASAGVIVGLVMGQFHVVRVTLEPLLNGFYVIPKLALLPILLLIFGGTEVPMIVLVAVSVFFVVMLNSLSAALLTPVDYIDVVRSFEASHWTVFWRVVFPASLPQVFAGLRVASGIALLMLVGAEFVAGNEGLGYLIWHAWSLFDASQMYVGIVVVSILGVVFTSLIAVIERLTIPWAQTGWSLGPR